MISSTSRAAWKRLPVRKAGWAGVFSALELLAADVGVVYARSEDDTAVFSDLSGLSENFQMGRSFLRARPSNENVRTFKLWFLVKNGQEGYVVNADEITVLNDGPKAATTEQLKGQP